MYHKRIDNKQALSSTVFNLFTDAVGGSIQEFSDTLYSKFTVEAFFYADDVNYFQIAQYFQKAVIPHKIAVYQAGLEMSRKEWFKENKEQFLYNLWVHDMSKFSANESYGYAMHDFKSNAPDILFERAWLHHKNHNEHHPEYWLNPNKEGVLSPMEMPTIYVLEMIADWIGAGAVYGSSLEEWLPKNLHKFELHEATAGKLAKFLKDMDFNIFHKDGRLFCK